MKKLINFLKLLLVGPRTIELTEEEQKRIVNDIKNKGLYKELKKKKQ